MICKVDKTIDRYQMLKKDDTVIVALSGGSDSMTLLNILYGLRDKYNLNIIAAHVNHCLRGAESDRDEAFVKNYCEAKGIEYRVLKINVSECRENGESVEEAGRRIRYNFFRSIDENAKIATAHNLSDRVETFLFNLTRGTGTKGLCSIPAMRENIIRPLINITKEEIVDYCKDNNIPFVTDSTNNKDIYTRNNIRHNVVPVLKNINPGFEYSVGKTVEAVTEDEMFLSSLAEELYNNSKLDNGFSVEALNKAPLPVLKRTVIKILSENCSSMIESKHILSVIDLLPKGGSVQIANGVTVRVRKNILDFPKFSEIEPWCVNFSIGKVEYPYGSLYVHKNVTDGTQKSNKQVLLNSIDCDRIVGTVKIRCRQSFDKFRLQKNSMEKSLKKLFNEYSIPPEERYKIPIICDDEKILWIKGFGASARVKCTPQTKTAYYISTEEQE